MTVARGGSQTEMHGSFPAREFDSVRGCAFEPLLKPVNLLASLSSSISAGGCIIEAELAA